MTQEEYMENLLKKFERHFEITKDVTLFGEVFDIYAEFRNICGRTFITKKDVIDKYENYEYCYIKKFDIVKEEDVVSFGQLLKRIVNEFVKPNKDHMSTYVTGVMAGNRINGNAKEAVRRYSYSKAFAFYLKGWCDVRLICIGLDDNEVITNKAGKQVQKVYQIAP